MTNWFKIPIRFIRDKKGHPWKLEIEIPQYCVSCFDPSPSKTYTASSRTIFSEKPKGSREITFRVDFPICAACRKQHHTTLGKLACVSAMWLLLGYLNAQFVGNLIQDLSAPPIFSDIAFLGLIIIPFVLLIISFSGYYYKTKEKDVIPTNFSTPTYFSEETDLMPVQFVFKNKSYENLFKKVNKTK